MDRELADGELDGIFLYRRYLENKIREAISNGTYSMELKIYGGECTACLCCFAKGENRVCAYTLIGADDKESFDDTFRTINTLVSSQVLLDPVITHRHDPFLWETQGTKISDSDEN